MAAVVSEEEAEAECRGVGSSIFLRANLGVLPEPNKEFQAVDHLADCVHPVHDNRATPPRHAFRAQQLQLAEGRMKNRPMAEARKGQKKKPE